MENGSIEEKYGCDIMLSENKQNANVLMTVTMMKKNIYVCVRAHVCVYEKNEFFGLEGSCSFLSIFL